MDIDNKASNTKIASACIRCGACLAIAQRLREVLISTKHQADDANWSWSSKSKTIKSVDHQALGRAMREACNTFHNYGLREYKGYRLISEELHMTKHVSSSLDGTWGQRLRGQCLYYLQEFGESQLYDKWRSKGSDTLSDVLCRSEGLFRDCKNIESPKTTEANSNVNTEDYWSRQDIRAAISLCFTC